MSYSLHLSNFSAEQVSFGYSAAHETLIALHVFFDCKHHPLHIPWVINARKKISPALKNEIDSFSLFFQRPIVSFWGMQEDSELSSFEDDLNDLIAKPIEVYQQTIIKNLLHRNDTSFHSEDVELILKKYPHSKEVIRNLVEDPADNRQQFLHLLEAFWTACLREEWPKMEDQFLNDISYRGRILKNEGPLAMLASLSDEIAVYPNENKAVIRRISKADILINEKEMLSLWPSYFAWPHLFVDRNRPIGINYSVMENQNEAKRPMPSEELMKFFKAMGDLTRLQIVRYLAQKPRSTQELAALIGVTEGAVSKHLKQLQDAGVVKSKRESYYVFYQLHEKPFHEFSDHLSHLISPF